MTANRPVAGAGPVEAAIIGLGHSGDGIAVAGGGRWFVPFAAPGDIVRLAPGEGARARLVGVITAGPARASPACRHFGACGGCALQHVAPVPYAAFKRDQVVRALAQRGFADAPVGAPVQVAPGTRRRAALKAVRGRDGAARLGFAERASHRIVEIRHCPVLRPALAALLDPLRRLAATIVRAGERAEVRLTECETGIALGWRVGRALDLAGREALAAFAEAGNLARIAWDDEVVVERTRPVMRWDGVAVALPIDPFLQATADGERAMIGIATEAVAGAETVADLFCGLGAFALPLSANARVDAFDSDAAAIAALAGAVRQANRPVAAARRDLHYRPLETAECDRYGAVVLDPPHAGARAQVERLATSRVPVIMMASCNPATFARDARILVDGGYRLDAVTPIDQFLWSAETEVVGVLRRDGA